MQPPCQICCNPKRRLRFHTEQVAICQWCVTELSSTKQSPAAVVNENRTSAISGHRETAQRELARLYALRKPPPQAPNDAIAQANQLAEETVRRSEGMLQSLYRSLLDNTRRRVEVATEAARRKDEILNAHRATAEAHVCRQREINSQISDLEVSIARIPELVETEVRRFVSESRAPKPTKSKEVRLIRAYFAGLLSYDRTELARPEALEYEELKKRIRARDSHRCICCLRGYAQGELHVHHILPLSRYGTNCESNLVTLCHPCHNKQHPDFQVTRTYPIKRRASSTRFVAVNIETTGPSNEDSIIEIAAVRFVGGEVEDVFCSFVRSKITIPEAVTCLTGITQSMISNAPHPETVIRDFVAFISNHRLVFHNAPFDMRYIKRYFTHFNLEVTNRVLDTLPIARKKLPELPSHHLSVLVEHLGLPVSGLHRAKDDSIATGLLYLALHEIASPRAKPGIGSLK